MNNWDLSFKYTVRRRGDPVVSNLRRKNFQAVLNINEETGEEMFSLHNTKHSLQLICYSKLYITVDYDEAM